MAILYKTLLELALVNRNAIDNETEREAKRGDWAIIQEREK